METWDNHFESRPPFHNFEGGDEYHEAAEGLINKLYSLLEVPLTANNSPSIEGVTARLTLSPFQLGKYRYDLITVDFLDRPKDMPRDIIGVPLIKIEMRDVGGKCDRIDEMSIFYSADQYVFVGASYEVSKDGLNYFPITQSQFHRETSESYVTHLGSMVDNCSVVPAPQSAEL